MWGCCSCCSDQESESRIQIMGTSIKKETKLGKEIAPRVFVRVRVVNFN